ESPATRVPAAEIATNAGPYTEPVWRQPLLTRCSSGSPRKSAGTEVYGFAWCTDWMRPYIVYDQRSCEPRGGVMTATMSSSAKAITIRFGFSAWERSGRLNSAPKLHNARSVRRKRPAAPSASYSTIVAVVDATSVAIAAVATFGGVTSRGRPAGGYDSGDLGNLIRARSNVTSGASTDARRSVNERQKLRGIGGARGSLDLDERELAPLAHREHDHEHEDDREEHRARPDRAERETAGPRARRQVVADRSTEWPGENVREPERSDLVELEAVVPERDQPDEPGEQEA